MKDGWFKSDPDDGIQYPANPNTATINNLALAVSGLGTVTIEGSDYTATGSPHQILDLAGATAITTAFGAGEDTLVWTGDTVTGSVSPYSIDMSTSMSIVGAFSSSVSYDDIIFYHNCDALGDAQKSAGTAAVVYGASVTSVAGDSPMVGNVWDTGDSTYSASTIEVDISDGNLSLINGRIGFYWSPRTGYVAGTEIIGSGSTDLLVYRNISDQTIVMKYRGGSASNIDVGSAIGATDVLFIEIRMAGTTAELFVDGDIKGSATGVAAVTATALSFTFTNPAARQHFDQMIFSNDVDRDIYAVRNITDFS